MGLVDVHAWKRLFKSLGVLVSDIHDVEVDIKRKVVRFFDGGGGTDEDECET